MLSDGGSKISTVPQWFEESEKKLMVDLKETFLSIPSNDFVGIIRRTANKWPLAFDIFGQLAFDISNTFESTSLQTPEIGY